MREYRYPSAPTRLGGGALSAAAAAFVLLLAIGVPAAHAGFAADEVFLPAIGRLPGALGSEFYTTVWVTNLTGVPVSFTFDFLKTGQANPSPASFSDSVAAGATKMYENVVETQFGLTGLGAGRIHASGELLVSERIYNQPPGAGLGDTEGLFFAAVPQSFSIHAGESATIQGVNQGGGEDFRYNFALIETAGGNPTVNVQVFDAAGAMLGQKAYPLSPYEQIQPSVTDVVPAIATTNARMTATVTGGSGAVLFAGAQVTNGTQDSSGFEMSFKGSLLGGGGGGTVAHDATLVGDGTGGSPLGLAIPLSVTNGTSTFTMTNGPVAVFGESDEPSNSGVGLWGRARNIAVFGEVVDGASSQQAWGELGRSFGGHYLGIVGGTLESGGTAVLAQYAGGSGPGTALELSNGALKVSGTNPTAFVHVAEASTLECDNNHCTAITNPLTDGDPNAMLLVTHNFTEDAQFLPSPFSVWYDGTRWTIYFDDTTRSIEGFAFNVLVIKQ